MLVWIISPYFKWNKRKKRKPRSHGNQICGFVPEKKIDINASSNLLTILMLKSFSSLSNLRLKSKIELLIKNVYNVFSLKCNYYEKEMLSFLKPQWEKWSLFCLESHLKST